MSFSATQKAIIMGLALIWFMAFAIIVSAAEIDTVNTFRGVKFGEPVSRYGKVLQKQEDAKCDYGDLEFYEPIPNEEDPNLSIGDVGSLTITYSVFKGKVCAAWVDADGIDAVKSLYATMVTRLGEPTISDIPITDVETNPTSGAGWIWAGKNLKVYLLYDLNQAGNYSVKLGYVWTPLETEMLQGREKRAKAQAKKDLD